MFKISKPIKYFTNKDGETTKYKKLQQPGRKAWSCNFFSPEFYTIYNHNFYQSSPNVSFHKTRMNENWRVCIMIQHLGKKMYVISKPGQL